VTEVVLNVVVIRVANLVYFFKFAPGMVTSLNTSIGSKSRSTTPFGKGRQSVVPIAIMGLAPDSSERKPPMTDMMRVFAYLRDTDVIQKSEYIVGGYLDESGDNQYFVKGDE
jgi:hypothetical protein